MVKSAEDLLLGLGTLELVADGESFFVNNFHGVEGRGRGFETAKIDVAEITATETTEKVEVVESELAGGGTEMGDGGPGGFVGLVGLVGAGGGEALGAEGADGDGAGAVEADVAAYAASEG